MPKRLLFLLILMILAFGLAVPTHSIAASETNRVDFTAHLEFLCTDNGVPDSFCSMGELRPLPNGKAFVIGFKNVFTLTNATDPRLNVRCLFTSDPLLPSSLQAMPVSGSFVCTPTDPAYTGGRWEGSAKDVFHPDSVTGYFHGKGYGAFDQLKVIIYNYMSNHYAGAAEGGDVVGTIIELPGYQP